MSSGVRPPVVPVRDGDRPILWPAVAVDPRPRAPAVRECDDRAATLEIVPLLPIEHREKFRVVQPVDLATHTPAPSIKPGYRPRSTRRPRTSPPPRNAARGASTRCSG